MVVCSISHRIAERRASSKSRAIQVTRILQGLHDRSVSDRDAGDPIFPVRTRSGPDFPTRSPWRRCQRKTASPPPLRLLDPDPVQGPFIDVFCQPWREIPCLILPGFVNVHIGESGTIRSLLIQSVPETSGIPVADFDTGFSQSEGATGRNGPKTSGRKICN